MDAVEALTAEPLRDLPEAFVAIHACNGIGAIYTVLFSGFSSGAVALRAICIGARPTRDG